MLESIEKKTTRTHITNTIIATNITITTTTTDHHHQPQLENRCFD